MSISLNANFELLSAGLYLDARQQFNTIIEMKDFAETSIPDGFITYNKETQKHYVFNSSNTVDATLGKWKEYNSGDSSSTTYATWNSNVDYKVGNVVLKDEVRYSCIADHTSTDFETDSINWVVVLEQYYHVTQEQYNKMVSDGLITDATKDLYIIDGNSEGGNSSSTSYTTLDELGLTADATVQDVVDAVPVGGTALLRTDEFTNWSTLLNGIQWGYLKVEKTVNGLSNIELQEVAGANRRYFGTQASGRFSNWKQVASEITDTLTNNSTSSEVPNANLVAREIHGKYLDPTVYSNALVMPIGKWRVESNYIASQIQNLPVQIAGILEIKYIHGSDGLTAYTSTHKYAMFTYTDIDGNIYKRALNSYNVAGIIVKDTGWQKIATQKDLEELFQSVSSGKTLVANAITGKGVSTATDATFATMATNISNIKGGYKEETKSYNNTSSGLTPLIFTFSANVIGIKEVVPPTYACRINTQSSGDVFTINGKELIFYVNGAGTWEVTALIKG